MSRYAAKIALWFAALVLLAGALLYITAPPRGLDGYRERAAASAEALASPLETALLWAQVRDGGRALPTTTLVAFEEAEDDADATARGFESYVPPAGAERLRSRFVALAGESTDALEQLRIAAKQGRWEELAALSAPLPGLSRRLERFEERAEP